MRHVFLVARLHGRGLRQGDVRQPLRPRGHRDRHLRQAHRDAGSVGLGAGRHRAQAQGRCVGDGVRPVCHAVPLARAVLQRDQVGTRRGPAVPAGRPGQSQSHVLHRVSRGHPDVRRHVRIEVAWRHGGRRTHVPSQPAAAVQLVRRDQCGRFPDGAVAVARAGRRRCTRRRAARMGTTRGPAVAAWRHRRSARCARLRRDELRRRTHLQARAGPAEFVGDAVRARGGVRAGAGRRSVPAARGTGVMHERWLRVAGSLRLPAARRA